MRENVVSSMGQKIGQMKEVDDPLLDHLHTYIYIYVHIQVCGDDLGAALKYSHVIMMCPFRHLAVKGAPTNVNTFNPWNQ